MATEMIHHRGYWQAEGLVELALSRFQAASERGNADRQRAAFYELARFHGRTLRVLNSGLHKQDEPLVQAALHNLMALHRGMLHMHRAAPHVVPLPIALSEHSRGEFVRDLIMRVLDETPAALPPHEILARAGRLDLMGRITQEQIHEHLEALQHAEHVERVGDGYIRTHRPYVELDKDVAGLRALIGRTFYVRFARAGYDSLGAIEEQAEPFRAVFPELSGFAEPYTADLFLDTVYTLLDTSVEASHVWEHSDLVHSPYPRPYQRAAFAALRRDDYHSLVIDAPTGSGKTLLGMMCIQDWLRTLDLGQSILVLVPTSNYQQQWVDELCYNPRGLRLAPELIFSGTIGDLTRYQQLTGQRPAVLLITYTALSQVGSPTGKGGFDAQSVEIFLQQAGVQHVILDEVHKVVEDMHSVATDLTRLLVSWQKDTSLRSLIGVSGTAEAYRSHFDALDLTICHRVPISRLVAAGFVAPFAEFGVPFAFSARERRIRELLDEYKSILQRYFTLLGPARLRQWLAQIAPDERRRLGHDVLGMYYRRADWQDAIDKRFAEWEQGAANAVKLTEAQMVSLIQIANGWSDRDLVVRAGADPDAFAAMVQALERIRAELHTLVYLAKTLARLEVDGFAARIDAARLRDLPQSGIAVSTRSEAAKDLLATTITGLYEGLSDWYLRTGEGRVATIKAVVEAERATRPISSTIVFDSGRHIAWRKGLSAPGYQGLAGLFSEMLGDDRFTVMAALSNEMYLSYDPDDPITLRIAEFIRQELMEHEIGRAIFNLLVAGLNLHEDGKTLLHTEFITRLTAFTATLETMHAARPGAFDRAVLRPLQRMAKRLRLGVDEDRLKARMDRRNVHLMRLVQTLFDYGLLATHFRQAHVGEVEQVSGARRRFFVVTMPGGARRKQLMYDLTARIVDAASLPVNFVIVSNWARTGWNVIQPNLLLDATATRDDTAWQQLRGRAIRAWPTWNNDCYRLLSILVGHHVLGDADETDEMDTELDGALLGLLADAASPEQQERVMMSGVNALDRNERNALAVGLLEARNKVTHIYELVKATGSTSQIIYDTGTKRWQRREAIALKHRREIGVNPFTGEKTSDEQHAPLIYAQDPRVDVPADLQRRLADTIHGCDDVVVAGWLHDDAAHPVDAHFAAQEHLEFED